MTDLEGRLRAAFGDRELAPATFHAFEHALRFSLEPNQMRLSVIERFLTAIDRAREIGRAAFSSTRSLAVVVEAWGEESQSRALRRDLTRLAALGLGSVDLASAERTEPRPDHREAFGTPLWRWRWCLETTEIERTLDTVLWLACSREMAVEPRLKWFSFLLIDFDRAVLANAYDDRGMDIAATESKEIANLYPRFRTWLLASSGSLRASVMIKGPGDPPDDPLLLYGPRPVRKFSLLIQIVSSLLMIGAFILAIYWLAA